MSTSTLPSNKFASAEKVSDWVVVALTLVAVFAGWMLKTSVENRSVPFNNSGVSAQTPQGWLIASSKGNEILHVTDPFSNGFGTTFILENIPVTTEASTGQLVSLLTLQRGQDLTAYRILEQKQVKVFGSPAYEIDYVFVETNPNLIHNELPNVVRGLDYIYLDNGHAIVATYWADEKSFEPDLGRFQQFLKSLKFEWR